MKTNTHGSKMSVHVHSFAFPAARSSSFRICCGAVAVALLVCARPSALANGIPEPGLAMFGTVINTNGSFPALGSGVVWYVEGGADTVTVPATLISVNGQIFYLALVPFETRAIGGVPTFSAGSNTLELTATSGTYTRSATVNGTNAVLQGTNTFTFGPGDRGRAERLDLMVNLPHETFSEWAWRIFGITNIDANADPLHKGMTYYQQYIAGTDPLDPNSVFKLISILPSQTSGIIVQWDSVPGKSYDVQRSAIVATNYIPMVTNLLATDTITSFQDSTANGLGPYFYRIQVHPP
jgi:hypothetical protein